MSDKIETILSEIRARANEERECGWHGEADDLLAWADRIEAEAKNMRAMLDANVNRVRELEAMREALVEISQMCGVGPNEVSAIAIAHICDKALRTNGE